MKNKTQKYKSWDKNVKIEPLDSWRRTHYSSMVTPDLDGGEVTIFGWIQDIRDLGNIVFITLRDREGILQVTATSKKTDFDTFQKLKSLGKQFAVGIKGVVAKRDEAPRGVELIPREVKVLGLASSPLPLDPTGRVPADVDVRLDARILDLRRPEAQAIFKVRHEIVSVIRQFLSERGYLEVHTPRIIAAAAEGGASLFPVEYFDEKAYLAQSPELYKEELISVFEKVFEIGTFFRAEESHTRRHLNEFISVDVEEAFAEAEDVMSLQEELLASILKRLEKRCATELGILSVGLPPIRLPLARYTYSEVIDQLQKGGFEIRWGDDLSTPASRALGQLHKDEFYFVTEWPTKIRPFYIKPRADKKEICEAFDFMFEWIEITSGGSRVDHKKLLIERLREQGLSPASFDFHLKTYDYGMPPHAGWGMGLDRLVMAILRRENIRDVVLFPRDRFRLRP
jgi:nondiscriminating aspartyl-tRNA synthetase